MSYTSCVQFNRRHNTRQFHSFYFFNDTAATDIYTLSLHDALPILVDVIVRSGDETLEERVRFVGFALKFRVELAGEDRKSTRLNSSHGYISYAVFCLKKITFLITGVVIILIRPLNFLRSVNPTGLL